MSETPTPDQPRFRYRYYVIAWLGLGSLFYFILLRILPGVGTDLPLFGGMACAFVFVYAAHSKIETGKTNISDALRWVVGFIMMALGAVAFGTPVVLLGSWISEAESVGITLLELVGIFVGGVIIVVVLLTILAWINDSSPRKEFEKCFWL